MITEQNYQTLELYTIISFPPLYQPHTFPWIREFICFSKRSLNYAYNSHCGMAVRVIQFCSRVVFSQLTLRENNPFYDYNVKQVCNSKSRINIPEKELHILSIE